MNKSVYVNAKPSKPKLTLNQRFSGRPAQVPIVPRQSQLCYRCGQSGHVRAQCKETRRAPDPNRSRRRFQTKRGPSDSTAVEIVEDSSGNTKGGSTRPSPADLVGLEPAPTLAHPQTLGYPGPRPEAAAPGAAEPTAQDPDAGQPPPQAEAVNEEAPPSAEEEEEEEESDHDKDRWVSDEEPEEEERGEDEEERNMAAEYRRFAMEEHACPTEHRREWEEQFVRAITTVRRRHDPDAVVEAAVAPVRRNAPAEVRLRPRERPREPDPPPAPDAAPPEEPPGPFGPDGPDADWWNNGEPYDHIHEQVQGWDFSFHDFPIMYRNFGSTVSTFFAALPLLLSFCIMLEWYPSLISMQIVMALVVSSYVIFYAPFTHTNLHRVLISCSRGTLGAFRAWRGGQGLTDIYVHNIVDDPFGKPIIIYFLLAAAIFGGGLAGSGVVLYAVFDYCRFIWNVAGVLTHWEEMLVDWYFPWYVEWVSSHTPAALKHMFAWLMWAKYIYITVLALRYYTNFFMRATSVTTITFVDCEPSEPRHDLRQFTFRNQDLQIDSCPVRLSFVRRIFGLIPIMSTTRVASATMIMELTAHKFLNGSVDLPDTQDRINRAMTAIGYINLDATDVFQNKDLAEISRLVAVSWAKSRLEANFGLKMQDF